MKKSVFSQWFKGIKGRLLFAAVVPVIGFAVVFFVALKGINRTNIIVKTAHETLIPNSIYLGDMRVSRNRFIGKAFESIVVADNPEKKDKAIKAMEKTMDEFEKAHTAYSKAPFIDGEVAVHDKVKRQIPEFLKLMSSITELLRSSEPEKHAQALEMLNGRFDVLSNQVRDFNLEVSQLYDGASVAESLDAEQTRADELKWLWIITLSSAFGIFGILIWVASSVSNSVTSIAEKINTASSSVASAVGQLNAAGAGLSQSSTESAASLEETVASLEELTSMVQLNSNNARQAAELSKSSKEAAENGEQEIKSLILAMNEISVSSKKIEEIISVIDDISFQTNLLALNAAVEAARAGEQGKGFAVVAEAVRTLAQKSAVSARDISTLIKDSVGQITKGSQIADQSGAVLTNIVSSIKKVSDLNTEIAAASTEQTTGIEQISKAMNQLDQAAQVNASSAEEISATSEEISRLANTAHDLTVELNAVILGGDKPGHSHEMTNVKSLKNPTNESFRHAG